MTTRRETNEQPIEPAANPLLEEHKRRMDALFERMNRVLSGEPEPTPEPDQTDSTDSDE